MSEDVLVTRGQGIMTITLNRPEVKNAANGPMAQRRLGHLHQLWGSARSM
jgi:enoyl-CoA hydratase/carnithine racemase